MVQMLWLVFARCFVSLSVSWRIKPKFHYRDGCTTAQQQCSVTCFNLF